MSNKEFYRLKKRGDKMSKKIKVYQVFYNATINKAQSDGVMTFKRGSCLVDIYKDVRKKVAKDWKQSEYAVRINALTVRKHKIIRKKGTK